MRQLISPAIEKVLKDTILPDLAKGRKDFDLPHTKAVVHWMKQLLTQLNLEELDSQVLITAAYAHDWGYIGLFEDVDSNDPAQIAKRKPLHMERGAQLITELITEQIAEYFSQEQIVATAQLVAVHDQVEKLKTESELLLMEADTLGMLDIDRVTPTFTKEDNDTFIEREIKGRRLPAFKHQNAKKIAEQLTQRRIEFFG